MTITGDGMALCPLLIQRLGTRPTPASEIGFF